MRDFDELVSEKLRGLEVKERGAIVREIAGHLEDRYSDLLAEGRGELSAFNEVADELGNGARLRRAIRRAKGAGLMGTLRKAVLPGILCVVMGLFCARLVEWLGFHPHVFRVELGVQIVLFHPLYLLMIALTGALGAYLSRELSGSRGDRLLAAEFPYIWFCCFQILFFVDKIGFFASWRAHPHLLLMWTLTGLLTSALQPGVFALLGALPFLMEKQEIQAPEATA
jgi:hypothetical protein